MENHELLKQAALERARQINVLGWTSEHDKEHVHRELKRAAGCYLSIGIRWPWGDTEPDKSDEKRNLIKAVALLMAEWDRIEHGY